MTPQQMIEFDARREAVLRHQLKTNPKYRVMRRERRVAFAAGVVRYVVAIGVLLFLIKSFLISQYGVAGYMTKVAPVQSQLAPGGLLAQALAPGQYSLMVAGAFGDRMPPAAPLTAGVDGASGQIGLAAPGS